MISTQWCRDHEDRVNICDGGLDSCWIDGMNLCDQEGERCFGVMINQFFTPNNRGVKLCLSDVLVDKGDWLVRMKTDADVSSTTLTNSATDSPLENAPASTVRCGSSWGDANGKCGTPCPSRSDAECTNGERCYADLSVLPCDNASTTSTTSSASNSPVNPTGEMCVHHSVMTCINNVSSYWPKCDPNQSKTNSGPSGYEFGHYCTEEWADAFNEMMSSPQVNKCHDREVVKRTLAQIAFETGYFSTVYQPLDGGAGLIHMIPDNWVINAADMDDIFNTGSSFETAARTMGKDFFQDHRYGWKSVAAWFLSTNRVISSCGKNLFEASYSEMTRCILSRESDRSEVYQHVAQCMDAYDSANPESSSTSTSTTTTTTTSDIVTANPSTNELCSSGISLDDICCNASCGTCGGDGCGGRPGGGSQCCAGSIRSSGNICEDPSDVACVISNDEEVAELPTREPTEEPSILTTPIPESTSSPECGNGFEVYSSFGSTTCSANHVKQTCPDGGINKNGCFLNGFGDCESLCRSHADCAYFFYNDVDWCALHTSCTFTREASNPGITCTRLITSTSTLTTSQASSTQVETTSSSYSPVTTCAETGFDYAGFDINADGQPSTENAAECQARCFNEPLCNFWTFNTQWNGCYLKTSDTGRYSNANRISGPKTCTVINPTHIPSSSPTLSPTHTPSCSPTQSPSTYVINPTHIPSSSPTLSPTHTPSCSPTQSPSTYKFFSPTREPTTEPSVSTSQNPESTSLSFGFKVALQIALSGITRENFSVAENPIKRAISSILGAALDQITLRLLSASSRRFLNEAMVEAEIKIDSLSEANEMARAIAMDATSLESKIESECEDEGLEVSVTSISAGDVSTENDVTTVNQAEDDGSDGMTTVILASAVAALLIIIGCILTRMYCRSKSDKSENDEYAFEGGAEMGEFRLESRPLPRLPSRPVSSVKVQEPGAAEPGAATSMPGEAVISVVPPTVQKEDLGDEMKKQITPNTYLGDCWMGDDMKKQTSPSFSGYEVWGNNH